MLVLVAAFIKLGLWQQHKADAKLALQTQLDRRLQEAPVALPREIADPEDWRYRRVRLSGVYEPRYQILLDNQVENETAGYHVITPLRTDDGQFVLVNRGWVGAPPEHDKLPVVSTPSGRLEVVGYAWLPPAKYFELEKAPASEAWQTVWQNVDMRRYAAMVPFKVLPFVVRLDPQSVAGGFARNWPRPAERIEMHVGYAYQWFGFALALVIIYIVVNVRKAENSDGK
jgi:surfeit locus 1 family protein